MCIAANTTRSKEASFQRQHYSNYWLRQNSV